MSDVPLIDALLAYRDADRSRFHMPGHSGKASVLAPLQELLSLDVTEIPGLDSLYEANGVIAQSEQKMAECYGFPLVYSTGGSTLAIQTMLFLALNGKKKLLCGRNAHKSALNTMALLGAQPVWLKGDASAGGGLFGRVTPEAAEQAFVENPDAAALYITSPDYYGVISDVRSLAAICHRHGARLLVDAAHGAHFRFLTENVHPVTLGADMAACSLHKTMPALTGSAILCFREAADAVSAKNVMAVFASTSPSYLIMASMDLCQNWMHREAFIAFQRLSGTIARLRQAAGRQGIVCPKGKTDPTRLTLGTYAVGIDGRSAAEIFRTCGVEPEYADRFWLILIPTPFHTDADIHRVECALSVFTASGFSLSADSIPEAPSVVPFSDAFRMPFEVVPIEKAKDRIAAEAVCTCPPGIPVILYGEQVTEPVWRFLINYGIRHIKVLK